MKPAIRAARPEDYSELGEDTLGYDSAAYVLTLEDRPIGIVGLIYCDPAIAFTKFLPECDNLPKSKVKLMRHGFHLITDYGRDVIAVASLDYPTANNLNEHFGFVYDSDTPTGERIYRWAQQQVQ